MYDPISYREFYLPYYYANSTSGEMVQFGLPMLVSVGVCYSIFPTEHHL